MTRRLIFGATLFAIGGLLWALARSPRNAGVAAVAVADRAGAADDGIVARLKRAEELVGKLSERLEQAESRVTLLGRVKLPEPAAWVKDGDARQVDVNVAFQRDGRDVTFRKAPHVEAALAAIDADKDVNLRLTVEVVSVSPHGFVMRFRTWGDSKINLAAATWVAVGEAPPVDGARQGGAKPP